MRAVTRAAAPLSSGAGMNCDTRYHLSPARPASV